MNEKEALRQLGFELNGGRLLPNEGDTAKIAMDAALQTVANVSIPTMFATYYSPKVVEILQAPMMSTRIFDEEKRGDWKDEKTMFPVAEYVGQVTAYSDFSRGLVSDANIENAVRDTHIYQTAIQCGDLEHERVAAQKLNLLSLKQEAAAKTLAIASNNFNFFGVEGKSLYGLLNEPNLPAAINASQVDNGGGATAAWADKTAIQIYNDVLELFNQISDASQGLVQNDSKLKLLVPPSIIGHLRKVTDFGVSPLAVIQREFTNLEILSVPQLVDDEGVASVMLIASDVGGEPTGVFGFMEKLRTSRVVQDLSYISQKWSASTTGFLLFRPFGIATMTGVQKEP